MATVGTAGKTPSTPPHNLLTPAPSPASIEKGPEQEPTRSTYLALQDSSITTSSILSYASIPLPPSPPLSTTKPNAATAVNPHSPTTKLKPLLLPSKFAAEVQSYNTSTTTSPITPTTSPIITAALQSFPLPIHPIGASKSKPPSFPSTLSSSPIYNNENTTHRQKPSAKLNTLPLLTDPSLAYASDGDQYSRLYQGVISDGTGLGGLWEQLLEGLESAEWRESFFCWFNGLVGLDMEIDSPV